MKPIKTSIINRTLHICVCEDEENKKQKRFYVFLYNPTTENISTVDMSQTSIGKYNKTIKDLIDPKTEKQSEKEFLKIIKMFEKEFGNI